MYSTCIRTFAQEVAEVLLAHLSFNFPRSSLVALRALPKPQIFKLQICFIQLSRGRIFGSEVTVINKRTKQLILRFNNSYENCVESIKNILRSSVLFFRSSPSPI